MINGSLYSLRVYGVRGVKINPTRKNVLGNKFLNMIVGGVNIFVTNPLPINTKIVNRLVEHYASEESVEVPAEASSKKAPAKKVKKDEITEEAAVAE